MDFKLKALNAKSRFEHLDNLVIAHKVSLDLKIPTLEIDKSFNVLNVCEMIAAAVQSMSVQTTQRCFRKAGVS